VESLDNIENIEVLRESGEFVCQSETPEGVLETEEEKIFVRRAIARLPNRLRETFILHFDRQLSYQEIAEQQNISYANVRKRISQARAILKQALREYFIGDDISPKPPFGRGAKDFGRGAEDNPPKPPFERGAEDNPPKPPFERGAEDNPPKPPFERGAEDNPPFGRGANDFGRGAEDNPLKPMAFGRGAEEECFSRGCVKNNVIPAKARIYSDRLTPATPVLIQEIPELFQRYWRVWMDSGGCQLVFR
jgi:hypothetical protein